MITTSHSRKKARSILNTEASRQDYGLQRARLDHQLSHKTPVHSTTQNMLAFSTIIKQFEYIPSTPIQALSFDEQLLQYANQSTSNHSSPPSRTSSDSIFIDLTQDDDDDDLSSNKQPRTQLTHQPKLDLDDDLVIIGTGRHDRRILSIRSKSTTMPIR